MKKVHTITHEDVTINHSFEVAASRRVHARCAWGVLTSVHGVYWQVYMGCTGKCAWGVLTSVCMAYTVLATCHVRPLPPVAKNQPLQSTMPQVRFYLATWTVVHEAIVS